MVSNTRKAQVAHVEELLLQVLEGRVGLVVGVARQVDLAVLADDGAGAVHDDRGVVARALGLRSA
jgi:hypothetical protein